MTKLLFTLEALGWANHFSALLQAHAPKQRWTRILDLLETDVSLPGQCACQPQPVEYWKGHAHAGVNRAIRGAITAFPGARERLYRALKRDLRREVDLESPWQAARTQKKKALLDFLRAEPVQRWFREPYNPEQMYQGDALKNQASNPGLAH